MLINNKHHNKRGRFKLRTHILFDNEWEDVKRLLEDFAILRAEHRLHEDAVVYDAISPHFDPVKPGDITPWYKVDMWFHEDEESGKSEPELKVQRLEDNDPYNYERP